MRSKCVWIGVAFLVAACGAFASQECGADRAYECKNKLMDIVFGGVTEETACGKYHVVSKCLRSLIDNCSFGREHPEAYQHLKQFEDYLNNNCGATLEGDKGDEDEVDRCLEKNQEYLLQCIYDEETGDLTKFLDVDSIPADIDPEFVQCYLYGQMAHCVVGRSEERCGEAGGERAADKLSDVPSPVKESCDSQQDSVEETFVVNLLGQRKKRAPHGWLAMNSGKR